MGHAERSHAILSASGASRWLNCTPSARLEDEYGKRTGSVFSREGTLAHEMAEVLLNATNVASKMKAIEANELYTEDMPDYVAQYVEYCQNEMVQFGQEMFVEAKLDLSEYIPQSFGTADCIIASDDVVEVIDLKYGKGVPVYADNNPQLKLYALGVLKKLELLYNPVDVILTIVQPRIDNISSWKVSVEELYRWADTELREKAQLAWEGKGDLQTGSWCKFCSVAARCKALYEQTMAAAEEDFSNPHLLSDEQLSALLEKIPTIKEHIETVQTYALDWAMRGKQWPNFKLVEGRSVRKFNAEEKEIAAVLHERYPEAPDEIFYDMKLKGITALEKVLGKKEFASLLNQFVVKPQGKPTLVPMNDKRPALDPSVNAVNDFKDG